MHCSNSVPARNTCTIPGTRHETPFEVEQEELLKVDLVLRDYNYECVVEEEVSGREGSETEEMNKKLLIGWESEHMCMHVLVLQKGSRV